MGCEGENGVPFPFSSPGGLACIPLEWPHPGTCHTWKMKAELLEADAWDRAVLRFCFRTRASGLSHRPCAPVEGAFAPPCLTLPHFSGLHTLSAVVPRVHKGHLADAPRLCDPYVLAAVTVARDDLIHLKHTRFSVTSLHGA